MTPGRGHDYQVNSFLLSFFTNRKVTFTRLFINESRMAKRNKERCTIRLIVDSPGNRGMHPAIKPMSLMSRQHDQISRMMFKIMQDSIGWIGVND